MKTSFQLSKIKDKPILFLKQSSIHPNKLKLQKLFCSRFLFTGVVWVTNYLLWCINLSVLLNCQRPSISHPIRSSILLDTYVLHVSFICLLPYQSTTRNHNNRHLNFLFCKYFFYVSHLLNFCRRRDGDSHTRTSVGNSVELNTNTYAHTNTHTHILRILFFQVLQPEFSQKAYVGPKPYQWTFAQITTQRD